MGARHLLRPDDAPNEGARRLRELLRTRTFGQIARKLGCDLSGVRRWAVGTWNPDRRMRERLWEEFAIAVEVWDEPPITRARMGA